MHNLIFYLFCYFLIITLIILISRRLKIFDTPNSRKSHSTKVLNTGGIGIGIFYMLVVISNEYNLILENILVSGLFILILGLIDDIKNLSPSTKLFGIIISVAYLIQNNLSLDNLGTYEFLGYLNLGKFSFLFTLLAVCLLINGINYIDGIDGLLLLNVLITLTYFYFLIKSDEASILIIYLMIPIVINLFLNFLPINNNLKIFSGDSGSLYLGFIISFFTISIHKQFDIHPVYLIWPLWYPIYDFLCVSIYRITIKKSPLKSDKMHFHHLINKKFNNSHAKSTATISLINILIIFIGYHISNFSELISFISFFVLFFIYYSIRNFLKDS